MGPITLILAVTTVADAAQADRLAALVLRQRLAACVSIQPLHSHYFWKGEQHQDDEFQLQFKTTLRQIDALRELVLSQHPYDLPEWLCWSVESSTAYAAWASDQLS